MITNQNIYKTFWCHSCRTQNILNVNQIVLMCPRCRSELIEEIESYDSHPSQFIPAGLEPRIRIPARPQPVQFIQIITSTIFRQNSHSGAPPASENEVSSLAIVQDPQGDCPICSEPLRNNVRRMPCQHDYHLECLTPWLAIHNTCPVCRSSIRLNR